MKLPGQQSFDAVNFGPDVGGGEAGNLGDGFGIHLFEIGQHDLAVERLQALDQGEQTLEGLLAIERGFGYSCALMSASATSFRNAAACAPSTTR